MILKFLAAAKCQISCMVDLTCQQSTSQCSKRSMLLRMCMFMCAYVRSYLLTTDSHCNNILQESSLEFRHT